MVTVLGLGLVVCPRLLQKDGATKLSFLDLSGVSVQRFGSVLSMHRVVAPSAFVGVLEVCTCSRFALLELEVSMSLRNLRLFCETAAASG